MFSYLVVLVSVFGAIVWLFLSGIVQQLNISALITQKIQAELKQNSSYCTFRIFFVFSVNSYYLDSCYIYTLYFWYLPP